MYALTGFIVVFLLQSTSCDIFDENTNTCQSRCNNDYTGEMKSACERGCRLYTIIDFARSDWLDCSNETLKACTTSCTEAYGQNNYEESCVVGCNRQKKSTDSLREEDAPPTIHLLTPLYHIYNMYGKVKDSEFRNMMSVSWSVYVQDDNGDIITVEDKQPHVRSDTPQKAASVSTGSDFLDCLSFRSGLPRWFLALTIFFSSMVMIWLCFATTITAPEQHVKETVSMKSDLEYLKLADLDDMKICPNGEAPALPLKINLEKV